MALLIVSLSLLSGILSLAYYLTYISQAVILTLRIIL